MRQTQGIYLISMVAETLDMHPQTLRKYERAGLVEPLRMGTLRTYSDEDVARLRLIKHFVEGLGLNLSGVELALSFTSQLLQLRTRLSRSGEPSTEVTDSVRQIDGMLAKLGVRVVRSSDGKDDPPPSRTHGAWFATVPGESIEFSVPRSS